MSIEEAIKKKLHVNEEEENTYRNDYLENRMEELKKRVREHLLKENSKNKKLLLEAKALQTAIWHYLEKESEKEFRDLLLTNKERQILAEEIRQQMIGYGIIDPLVKDESITEIMINGIHQIFIEQRGQLALALDEDGNPLAFQNETELLNLIEKIVAPINRKIDESDPIVDARLPDGSRVNIVIRPVSLEGPIVTIRKFPDNPYTMEQLIEFGAIDQRVASLLHRLVNAKYNIVISGGTGSGKTTFLNALSMYIPPRERIITVEDSAELKLNQIVNLVRLETRPPNIEKKGEITMRDLVKTALRMRPDRIVVGEVRGGEALDMLQAMNTGHDGSLTTGHANSAADMLSRLETMVLMSGLELPISAIRRQISSAVEIIVQLGRMRDGSRKVLQITEVREMVNGEIDCVDLFKWKMDPHLSTNSCLVGQLESTGEDLMQTGKWEAAGYGECVLSDALVEEWS
ncbi:CpaF family protein [Halalkalibacter krulwichiae]|uniref:Putative conjugal transfer protein/MT3759 n=1 Tax=Halalkalibacter krulwichiae TaxID=199441 RepID=A0A1X9MEX1_9BACI|nr:CpaF family protein [Halalkalibacter krulwichiae]ARK31999.1 Putative conjugal transfer protein/MT3759 [Halalkalibacter krulwichiae]